MMKINTSFFELFGFYSFFGFTVVVKEMHINFTVHHIHSRTQKDIKKGFKFDVERNMNSRS